MNASLKIKSLRDGLAQYLCTNKPIMVLFKDAYGEIYAGISKSIVEIAPKTDKPLKVKLCIAIDFDTIRRIKILKNWNGLEFYEQIGENLVPTKMEFDIVHFEKDPTNIHNINLFLANSPKERLHLLSGDDDIKKYKIEILKIKVLPT